MGLMCLSTPIYKLAQIKHIKKRINSLRLKVTSNIMPSHPLKLYWRRFQAPVLRKPLHSLYTLITSSVITSQTKDYLRGMSK